MQGIRFYEEFENKRKGISAGNVTAIMPDAWIHGNAYQGRIYDGVSGLFSTPNSPVASTGVADVFLRTKCKRISESKARTIHQALFASLDLAEQEVNARKGK